MSTPSIWETFAPKTNYPELFHDVTADVAIIGGGICGITAAQLLSEQGLKVVVLESLRIGTNSTGHSTGNLYETLGKEDQLLRKKQNAKILEKVYRSRRDALTLIENNIERFAIDCDFRRVPFYYYSSAEEADKKIDQAHKYALESGLAMEFTQEMESHLPSRKALRLDHQAQFNPLLYVQGLARAIVGNYCEIYEHSKVIEVEEKEDHCLVKTINAEVTARFVIHATHTPKGIMTQHTLMGPYREYGIACRISDPQHAPGIFFGHYDAQEIISTRQYERKGKAFVIIVGEPHKVGQGNSDEHIQKLEDFARTHFKVEEVTHRWGGQHYKPADELPYIGRKGKNSLTFIATGFSTHGLTYGTTASMIISDLIMGRENEFSDLYDPTRFTPIKSSGKFLKENVNNFFEIARDYLKTNDQSLAEIGPDEGKVLTHSGHKLAVYRDESNRLQICSAVCTHMGCIVHFNHAEKSWDCPCHGSRFATSGEVLEGPALHALPKADLVDDEVPLRNPGPALQDNLGTGLGI